MYIYTYPIYGYLKLYIPQGYINPICKYSPESVSTDSTTVRVDVCLIIWPQPNRTIGLTFRPRPRCYQLIWSLLWLFLVFRCRLFLNRIVGSSHTWGHIPNKLPLHSCGKESSSLVFCRQTVSLSISRFFVSMSDPLSSVWIFTRVNSPSFTFSRNLWYLLCICLVRNNKQRSWLDIWCSDCHNEVRTFFASSLAHWENFSSISVLFPAFTAAIYFASVVDKASLLHYSLPRHCSACIGHHIPRSRSTWVYSPQHVRIGKSFEHIFSDSEPKAYTWGAF